MQRVARPLVVLLMAVLSGPAWAEGDDSLYRALGGQAGIAGAMTEFVGRARQDPRIGGFFKETDPRHLAQQLTDQICQVSGGPCKLDGPDMKTAHESMKIAQADFNTLVEVLQQTLDDRGVPFAAQNRLLARLAPMHREIVNLP
jgi:hemoglobin